MTKVIIDYNASVITPIANGVNIPIPTSPAGVSIATTSVNIDPANPASSTNKVELNATFGYRSISGEPEIIVRLWRAGTEIYYALAGDAFDGVDEYSLVSLQMIEHAPLGTQNYQLIVENRNAASTARVIGPITFTAIAIGG
ncbi:hypothetical protein H1230_19470 [Paenibacillus sp. 19GGS1-52]|uniref:hypothetical protein n=1 Tax=Paenibacillus sp. 19GGS1-52 TaxID=2758563 RepID=UPI001EFAD14E|nr:hypothetical protein [Paenibacillus sp. 19GGS1-52]ULO05281.1 hypothetical protein H1230_19470 [Paenibacillus sp. 19GGS1-52]